MVRKGISPTPNSKINAKASSHVTTMMHEKSLVQYLIAETYNNGRFYQQTPALQSSAVYPCCIGVIKVNPTVLVRDKSKRIVRTYDTPDITH